jgi:hypothetical protein
MDNPVIFIDDDDGDEDDMNGLTAVNGGKLATTHAQLSNAHAKVMDTLALLTQKSEQKNTQMQVYYCPRNLDGFHTLFGAWNPSSLSSAFFCGSSCAPDGGAAPPPPVLFACSRARQPVVTTTTEQPQPGGGAGLSERGGVRAGAGAAAATAATAGGGGTAAPRAFGCRCRRGNGGGGRGGGRGLPAPLLGSACGLFLVLLSQLDAIEARLEVRRALSFAFLAHAHDLFFCCTLGRFLLFPLGFFLWGGEGLRKRTVCLVGVTYLHFSAFLPLLRGDPDLPLPGVDVLPRML